MAIDIMGRDIAGPGDAADFQASLERYSLTDRAPVVVANMTEANQLATTLNTEGLTEAFPLFVYVEDLQRHLCRTDPGAGWIILGGRLHGATANIRRYCPDATLTELHVSGSGFTRHSPGFTRHADGGILIPETGTYRIRFHVIVDGIVGATPGRRYVSLWVNEQPMGGDIEFEGATNTKLFDELEIAKGASVMAMCYQATGATRDVTGSISIRQSLTPSW